MGFWIGLWFAKVMDRNVNISLLDILETFVARRSIQNDVVQIDLDEKMCVWLFLFSQKEHDGLVQGYYTIYELHEPVSHCLKGKINTNSMSQRWWWLRDIIIIDICKRKSFLNFVRRDTSSVSQQRMMVGDWEHGLLSCCSDPAVCEWYFLWRLFLEHYNWDFS